MSLRIAVVDAAATRELRRAVLRPGWAPGSAMPGDDQPDAVYVAALDEDDDAVVGCCLVLPRPYPACADQAGAWQLRGMAVGSERQGHGVGAAVLHGAVVEVRRRGGRLLWCDARTSAVGFYRRQGFATDGDEFLHADSGLPHYRMWRNLDPRAAPGPVQGRFPSG